jgi:hypothetical protein
VFGIGLGIDTGGIALKFALFTAQLALAIVADFLFVRIANIAAFAAVFGIGLGINAFVGAIGLARFAIEDALAVRADLAIFAFGPAFAAVICAGLGIDTLVAAVNLAGFAIGNALRALALQHALVPSVAFLVIAGIGRYAR